MENLTPTEERIMQVIWKLDQAFVKDIIELLPEPKPPYNTVSSVVRLLEKKEFLTHKAYGKTYEYYPIISVEEYSKRTFKTLLGDYFNGSFQSLVSFMVDEENLSDKDLKEISAILKSGSRKSRKNDK